MPLQVGPLARATGLTVRTLHHYDEIGLLKPSGRTESGYRIYSDADVARLHAIQALRHLGLPLAEIGPMLDGRAAAPEQILEQQMLALDHQIRQATELRERLALLRDSVRKGETPGLDDWVQSLSLMATYGRYFSAGEIRAIFSAFDTIEEEWTRILAEVRACMEGGAEPESDAAQAVTRRWMALVHRWMGGDVALMERWGAMFRHEPSAHGVGGAPPTDMLLFMERAIDFRKALLRQHFGEIDFVPRRMVPDAEWLAVEAAGRKLLAARSRPTSKPARALRRRWESLIDQMAGGNADVRARLRTLHEGDPRLLAGAPLSREVRLFLLQVPDDA